MTFRKIGGLSLYEFPSFEEYLDRAGNPQWKKRNKPNLVNFVDKNKPPHYHSGFGTPAFAKHLHNARYGWADTNESIAHWANMVIQDISSQLPKPEIQYDKTGTFWDVGRIVEGDPECWLHEQPSMEIDRPEKGNIIRMVINTASSAAVRSSSHLHRCGAILALCVLFEQMGFYVQFEIATAIQTTKSKIEFRTVAKYAHEALNLAAVSYWCSADMERHIDFAICETMEECWFPAHGPLHSGGHISYGSPIYVYDAGDICFDRMHADQDGVNWSSPISVRQYIIKQLGRQGVLLAA